MKRKDNNIDKKFFYVFITCLTLSIVIMGATFAYFTSRKTDAESIHGSTAATSFNMSISKVTSLDLAFGLIPMKNIQAPYAAEQLCYDDNNRIGCQIYKITLSTNGDDDIFVDGFITTDVIEGIETRFTRVYPKDVEVTDEDTGEKVTKQIFTTTYTKEDMLDNNFDEDLYIKSGKAVNAENRLLNKVDDYSALLVENEKIDENGTDIYVMMWIWDDDSDQNFIQGRELVYTGTVTFNTADGNQIKATFD